MTTERDRTIEHAGAAPALLDEIERLRARAEADDAMLLAVAQACIQAGMRAANQRRDVPIALAIIERVKRGAR